MEEWKKRGNRCDVRRRRRGKRVGRWTRGVVSGHAVEEAVLMFERPGLMEAWQACSDTKETTYVNAYCSVRGVHSIVASFVFGPIVW
jgi:hypothetical protein